MYQEDYIFDNVQDYSDYNFNYESLYFATFHKISGRYSN
jgi:hypothetical protein